MNKKYLTYLFILFLSAIGSHKVCAQEQRKKPNVIFILADDLGYGDLKCFNPNAQTITPNLTSLAKEGMIFTDAHSASSVCTPSRYGLITGRYAFRTEMKSGVLGGYSPALIEKNRFTIGNLLKNAGYNTALIGKWHLGLDWKPIDPSKAAIQDKNGKVDLSNIDFSSALLNGPNNLGFDFSYILPASLDMSPYTYLENGISTDYPLIPVEGKNINRGIFWRGGFGSKSFKIEKTLDNFVDRAEKYITTASKDETKPFFLYLALTAPHTPWLPADEFKNKSKAGTYGDFVDHTDYAVGRILALLRSLKLEENTLVIFSSDNGADWKKSDLKEFPAHQANFIFKGEKSDIWEGGHRIPLIMKWPGKIKAGESSNTTLSLVDMMATFADLTKQKLPKGAGPDSYDFWPLISGKRNVTRPDIIHHSNEGMFAIRKRKWKFIDGNGSGGWSKADVNDTNAGQLYDLEKDPSETTNLYAKYPKIVADMKSLLEKQKQQGFSVGNAN